MTKTDKAFDKHKPEYYIFGEEVLKKYCRECDKPFETTLEFNRFCLPECKLTFLGRIVV